MWKSLLIIATAVLLVDTVASDQGQCGKSEECQKIWDRIGPHPFNIGFEEKDGELIATEAKCLDVKTADLTGWKCVTNSMKSAPEWATKVCQKTNGSCSCCVKVSEGKPTP